MKNKNLYFVAIVPNPELVEKIRVLKQQVADKYFSFASLKLPAHITLIPPFYLKIEKENQLIELLQKNVKGFLPFNIGLNGFGNFKPKVIYINVEENSVLKNLFMLFFNEYNHFVGLEEKPKSKFHPHITIAFRDLDKEHFTEAWNYFNPLPFSECFNTQSITLFKHNGKVWEVLKELKF